MVQYINKDALVAEIERLKNIYNDDENIHHVAKYNILVDILSFIDTLKVKEVDLESEIKTIWNKDFSGHFDVIGYTDFVELAKHFFELGLKVAQKGE